MKFSVFFLYFFTFASIVLSRQLTDDVVGFNIKKVQNYFRNAILGFRDVILNGDKELGYPAMDPYNIGDITWNSDEKFANNRLHLYCANTTLAGLSEYKLGYVKVNPKDLSLRFMMTFHSLMIETPYKLDGYTFNNWLPLYGDGYLTLEVIPRIYFFVNINLSLQESYVTVENVTVKFVNVFSEKLFHASATGLLDLPSEFSEDTLSEIFSSHYESMQLDVNKLFSNHARKVVEDAVGGMTMSELFEFIDYFAQRT